MAKERKSNIAYVNKEGKKISLAEWTKARSNPSYCNIRQYEGEKIAINAVWHGRIADAIDKPEEYWEPFKVEFCNIINTGTRPGTFVSKQIMDSAMTFSFRLESEALSYYVKLLTDFGLLTIEEDYEGNEVVTEVGNRILSNIHDVRLLGMATIKHEKKAPVVNKNFGSW